MTEYIYFVEFLKNTKMNDFPNIHEPINVSKKDLFKIEVFENRLSFVISKPNVPKMRIFCRPGKKEYRDDKNKYQYVKILKNDYDKYGLQYITSHKVKRQEIVEHFGNQ